jgi:hypothetical protein
VFFSLDALQGLCRNPKEIAMSIRSMLVAAAFALASLEAAHADGLRPIDGKSIDLGEVSGIAYYTVERDGFHVVTTIAQGMAGTPIPCCIYSCTGSASGFLYTAPGRCARNQPERRQRARPQGEIGLELRLFGQLPPSHDDSNAGKEARGGRTPPGRPAAVRFSLCSVHAFASQPKGDRYVDNQTKRSNEDSRRLDPRDRPSQSATGDRSYLDCGGATNLPF